MVGRTEGSLKEENGFIGKNITGNFLFQNRLNTQLCQPQPQGNKNNTNNAVTQVAGLSQFGNIRSILGSSSASTVTRHEQLQEVHYSVNFGFSIDAVLKRIRHHEVVFL